MREYIQKDRCKQQTEKGTRNLGRKSGSPPQQKNCQSRKSCGRGGSEQELKRVLEISVGNLVLPHSKKIVKVGNHVEEGTTKIKDESL